MLIPPGVTNPDLPRRVFQADVVPGRGTCPTGEGPASAEILGLLLSGGEEISWQ